MSLKKFLQENNFSRNTQKSYFHSLKRFFAYIYDSNEDAHTLAERYLADERNYEEDIKGFLHLLQNVEKRAPKTVRAKITSVKSFLLEYNIELGQSFWRKMHRSIKGKRARTVDRIPKNNELKAIVTHLPVHGKALFLLMASSGVRINEALSIELDDVDLENNEAIIRGEKDEIKSSETRRAFFSSETKEYVIEWLKVREKYLMSAVGKSWEYGKKSEDNRLFPFADTTAYTMWNSALKKTGHGKQDKSTKWHVLHPHVLRKFFNTKMKQTGIPTDVVVAMMGHEGYLTQAYRRHTLDDFRKFYKEGEYALSVFGNVEQVGQIHEEMKAIQQEKKVQDTQLQQMQNGYLALHAENTALQHRIKAIERQSSERIGQIEQELIDMKQRMDVLNQFSELVAANPEFVSDLKNFWKKTFERIRIIE